MLQSMREKMQGIIAGAICAVIALTFALFGIQYYTRSNGASDVVAKVNGEKITTQKLSVSYERIKRQQLMHGGEFSLDQKAQAQLKQTALQALIRMEVLKQATTKMGMGIGSQQVSAIIAQLPMFQVNGHFSAERFQQVLENLVYSQAEFLSQLEFSLVQTQLEKGIIESNFVLPTELANALKLLQQTRDFRYVVISPERFASVVKISPEDIKKYYDQHKEEFTTPEKVSLQYLLLSADDLAAKIKTTPEQLKQYYQEHIDSFSKPKRMQLAHVFLPLPEKINSQSLNGIAEKLNAMQKKIAAGEDVKQVMGSSGNIVWMTQNSLAPDFAQVINKMQPGQVSIPFRTKEGYNLVKLIAVEQAVVLPYEKVAAKVKQVYMHAQLMQLYAEQNDKLTDLTYTNSDSLDSAAKELGLPIKTTGIFTSAGEKTGFLANPKIFKTAFSDQVLRQKYNSNPIEIGSGKIVVLRIKDHVDATLLPLNQVAATITEKLRASLAKQKGEELGKEIATALQNRTALPELSKKYNLDWKIAHNINVRDKKVSPEVLQAAFNLGSPTADKYSVTTVDLPNNSLAVVMLDAINMSNSNKMSAAQQQQAGNELANALGQFDYLQMIDGWTQHAKIKTFTADKAEKE